MLNMSNIMKHCVGIILCFVVLHIINSLITLAVGGGSVSVQYSPFCSEMLTLALCLEFKTKHYGKERQDRLCSCL